MVAGKKTKSVKARTAAPRKVKAKAKSSIRTTGRKKSSSRKAPSKSAAKTNCSACVEQRLRKLGIRPPQGENEVDLLTGVRLPSSDINSLQSACNETDASAQ